MANTVDSHISSLTYSQLDDLRTQIEHRLEKIALPAPPKPRKRPESSVPLVVKIDTHHDYLCKEMQWLATDYAAERKRQISLCKKLSNAVKQYHENKEARVARELAEAALKRRRLAAKIGREIKGWWSKIEKVITYKQKADAEEGRRKEMNKQLVKLVKLTEKYTEGLARQVDEPVSDDEQGRKRKRMTIEEALSAGLATRKSKQRITDYTRVKLSDEESFYGETTASDSGSDASYAPDDEDWEDDETTLLQAELEERLERQQRLGLADDEDNISFQADPHELKRLQEEATMDINQVIERLTNEYSGDKRVGNIEQPRKRVKFAEAVTKSHDPRFSISKPSQSRNLDGEDADDDADASDVEEFLDNASDDGSEEYVADVAEVDDETTIAAEERLPREVSVEDEINLLKMESELSIDELRKVYGAAFSDNVQQENKDPLEVDRMFDEGLADDLEEFQPRPGEDLDDETTIEAEERLGRDMSYTAELELLKKDSDIPIDELHRLYSNLEDYEGDEHGEMAESGSDADSAAEQVESISYLLSQPQIENDESTVDEYVPDEMELADDESTIDAEERLGREISPETELSQLRKDSEIPIETLRAMYDADRHFIETKTLNESEGVIDDDDTSDAGQAALEALEASAEEARSTLATRPFLLSPWVKLREYQQIGLNWLVSLQSRRLNGILADEMGLGKTLQTIALLAYLAAYRGLWGPHLIVVPTSVILNWENELKRFCPAFKVLCYYGSAKRRKELRQGWTKTNWYHVVVTSYQLAVQDAFAFKRKKWYYLVLDEAQNIKNFQSQRWQTLINFNTQRRLLLTGTPLQNSLMELWSLLHFLMPYIFRSRKEFSYWFANPMTSMIEGNVETNVDIVNRLHGIIRPFVLRRLKKDVETQMPGKFEHIIKCSLSRRQLFIYEEFMARSSTRQALKKGGNFLGMMNVLMQLRKVCNHPDLFEPRPVVTPFVLDTIPISLPARVFRVTEALGAFHRVSDHLLVPLWCGSCGLPAVNSALRHGHIESEELRQFDATSLLSKSLGSPSIRMSPDPEHGLPQPLINLLSTLHDKKRRHKNNTSRYLSRLNRYRCTSSPFPYSEELMHAVQVKGVAAKNLTHDALSTPLALIHAMRSERERAEDVHDLVKRFVFCVPKASASTPTVETSAASLGNTPESEITEALSKSLEYAALPYREALSRLTSFFPDKKLVQYDSGKLQTLAALLRELKRGGHRVLIFTQMSKMLDILEAFLNLNGHTYLRLDGSTGVDRRQRLMDRFNNDAKVFCFILSTRSGGLGINLTGADTVIFYDSDWNPAMDAQAQDRAHRIGQTREVHIFRLVTEHSVEENILLKAQQKRNLDILVMDKGNFDASQLFSHRHNARALSEPAESTNVLTKGGLRAILGAEDGLGPEAHSGEEISDAVSKEQMEKAMASLEDADDVQALRGAQKEAADELREFDESIEIQPESEDETTEKPSKETSDRASDFLAERESDEKSKEAELEAEFAAWQNSVGLDATAIEASLGPSERYGLRFREQVDPFYSIFAVMEYRRKLEAQSDTVEDVDIALIEREKAKEEQQAIRDGDLLATRPEPEDLIRQRYLYNRERARLKASKKRRKMTGEDWEQRVDGLTKLPFWYNIDTGEALWDKPASLLELEAYERAQEMRFSAMPTDALVHAMRYLLPYPDRMNCGKVCKQWHKAAKDVSFVLHVYPVEMGAYTRDESKIEFNHFRTISDALNSANAGDSIELGDGHYWIKDDIYVDFPVSFIGDEDDPTNVVVEISGTMFWRARGGWCEGVTFRRPKIITTAEKESSKELLHIEGQGRLSMLATLLDNTGYGSNAVAVRGHGRKGRWEKVVVKGAPGSVFIEDGAFLDIADKDWNHN